MEVPEFYAKDRQAWRDWLIANHDKEAAVWLIFDKGPARTMTWREIVQEELCFGWIDSTAGRVSDTQAKIYICRRKPKSAWSKINKAHVEIILAAGLMTAAGQQAIDTAKANGAWDILNRSDNLELPPQLAAQLEANQPAKAHFEAFPPSAKRVILEWIYAAKRDETRDHRIQETVRMATDNQRAR